MWCLYHVSPLLLLVLSVAGEDDNLLVLDTNHDLDLHVIVEREAREEGSGDGFDFHGYGIDDEDHDFGSTNLMSSIPSRVVPVESSPVFEGVSTSSRRSAVSSSSVTPHIKFTTPDRPARPPRLSSYYPDLRSVEGSGVAPDLTVYNESDLISPTRTQYNGPASSLTPPYPNRDSESSSEYSTTETNHEPFLQSRLNKVPLNAGKSSRIVIPANTFQDLEDGNTRDLKLEIVERDTGVSIDDLGWARFKTESQEIISLPLEQDIGLYNFRVVATDSGGESQQDTLVVSVRQLAISRTFHHEFQATFAMLDRQHWPHQIDWKFELLNNIVSFFGDSDTGKITVLELSELSQQPGVVRFRWTNDSLPRQSCPRDSVTHLFQQLSDTTGRPSPGFRASVQSQFRVTDVGLEWKGLCHESRSGQQVTTHGTGIGYDNSMPQIRNPVDKLNVTAGELLQYQVPSDMCWDKENGGTRDLNLQLLTLSRLEVDSNSWLQFDTKNQEFVGVPLENDVGREEYQLVCSDSEGYSAIDGIEVSTLSRPFYEKFNLLFVFVFNDTLDDGARLARSRVKLLKKIAKIFRDPDTSLIVLNKVDPVSFEVAWYNKTLSTRVTRVCPLYQITKMQHFLTHQDTGAVRQRVVQAFEPHFHLAEVKFVMLGSCLDMAPSIPDTTGDPIHDLLPPQEYILVFVVPALIIISMLLLAVLIACILHRKRKAGKLDMFKTEALPPRIPVIMQDELSEHENFNMSKQPIILREEPTGQSQVTSYGRPPQYYGSSRHEDDFSESESLVNGNNGMNGSLGGHGSHPRGGLDRNMPPFHSTYARPPPVSLEFSDNNTITRNGGRHRPAPQYRKQHFDP